MDRISRHRQSSGSVDFFKPGNLCRRGSSLQPSVKWLRWESLYIPTLTDVHELWIVSRKKRGGSQMRPEVPIVQETYACTYLLNLLPLWFHLNKQEKMDGWMNWLCKIKQVLRKRDNFHRCALLLLRRGPVKIPAETLSCKCPHIDYRFFPWIAVFCPCKDDIWKAWHAINLTIPAIDLMKRDRCKAAVTQRGIWCRMPARCLKNKETKRRETYNRIMQS